MIRVAHIWNTAGIGGLLARYMDRVFNYESFCLMRKKFDQYGLATEKVQNLNLGTRLFIAKCLWEVDKCDIIHIHSGYAWLRFFKGMYPNKKYIIHLHGSDIRYKWGEVDLSGFDKVIVSTPDLLYDGLMGEAVYLPNPVDWELISSVRWVGPRKGKAFHVDYGALDEAEEYSWNHGVELVVHDKKVKHKKFLHIMGGYEYYVDVKRGRFPYVLEAMSLTGLEALCLGCKVINWEGDLITEFPKENMPLNVAVKLDEIYREVLENV